MLTQHLTRRSLVRRTGLLTAAVLAGLSGCTPTNEGFADDSPVANEQGYISGAGVITQLAAPDRGEPIELSGEYTTGEAFDLASWRGAPVVLNLWYAACPPCRTEAPALQANFKRFHDDGVQFLGLNVRDGVAAADAFSKTFNLTFPSMIDKDGRGVSALNNVLPPQAVPSTVVLDSLGRPAARVVGAVSDSTLKALLTDVLNESP